MNTEPIKPNFIQLPQGKRDRISYPVGIRMNETLRIIEEMASLIYKTFPYNERYMGRRNEYINLYVMGSSGAILAGILITLLKDYTVTICHIKKEGEVSHGGSNFSSHKRAINVILDDFIESGATVNKIYDELKEEYEYFELHLLCVSGPVVQKRLNFTPYNIISAYYNDKS